MPILWSSFPTPLTGPRGFALSFYRLFCQPVGCYFFLAGPVFRRVVASLHPDFFLNFELWFVSLVVYAVLGAVATLGLRLVLGFLWFVYGSSPSAWLCKWRSFPLSHRGSGRRLSLALATPHFFTVFAFSRCVLLLLRLLPILQLYSDRCAFSRLLASPFLGPSLLGFVSPACSCPFALYILL